MKVRITNNKNIQTMEQKDIDIFEILKGEEYGTELYTPICGRVWHSGMANDKDSAKAIWTEDGAGREHFFDKNGKIYKEGEVLLFPSNEMRDWSKFFKKGDVLEFAGDNGAQGTCTFEKFKDETKAQFLGRFAKEKECICKRPMIFRTADWVKSDDPAGYIRFVEERLGGKLNREKYRAYQKEYWSKHYRNYGTKNRVADRAMRERKKPDVDKALSMFKNPQQAAHLAWLLENKKNNRS